MVKLFNINKSFNLHNIPEENGIYFFYDKGKNILYIGKSTNLKKRFLSYFNKSIVFKTKKMVSQSEYFSYIKVNSEIQALLLEADLIKKYQPQYNIELKDDKRPLYIKITKEKYPRILTARKIDNKNIISFYGPFPSSKIVKDVLKLIRTIFPYSQHKVGKRACLESQINLCNPCPSEIENTLNSKIKLKLKKLYLKNISNIKKLLNGKDKTLRRNLVKTMENYSKIENFEDAIKIRDQISKLDYIIQKPNTIKEFLENPNFLDDQRKIELKDLGKILSDKFHYKIKVKRMECFDISHLQGSNTAASMVTFLRGEPYKSFYRHFRIKQRKGNDDISSLKEVAERRAKHFLDWGKPDLIVVDGGKSQVGIFCRILKKFEIPIIGLAKRNEIIIIPIILNKNVKFQEMDINGTSALNLLIRLRNEAHRFALKYHHKLVKKQFYQMR